MQEHVTISDVLESFGRMVLCFSTTSVPKEINQSFFEGLSLATNFVRNLVAYLGEKEAALDEGVLGQSLEDIRDLVRQDLYDLQKTDPELIESSKEFLDKYMANTAVIHQRIQRAGFDLRDAQYFARVDMTFIQAFYTAFTEPDSPEQDDNAAFVV